jgi:hypothetical protein
LPEHQITGFEYIGKFRRPKTEYLPEREYVFVQCKTCQAIVTENQRVAHRAWHSKLRGNFKSLDERAVDL